MRMNPLRNVIRLNGVLYLISLIYSKLTFRRFKTISAPFSFLQLPTVKRLDGQRSSDNLEEMIRFCAR